MHQKYFYQLSLLMQETNHSHSQSVTDEQCSVICNNPILLSKEMEPLLLFEIGKKSFDMNTKASGS